MGADSSATRADGTAGRLVAGQPVPLLPGGWNRSGE
ncbi:hypothetical protein AvCA_12260 [Azotobacter vinelandii CA]|uniref:Uncharacterized protein n=2 Tax=Azotobacter vinelandii TaxID=354 RepID=C1DQ01_AZOVD|nr:hypothetical protein Avin_12260 [Azotobacter vinelandii DJ]AGK17056.1 hypothetical protein AvCA_12260 [Azotobacter vinelandii CA]AGK19801.1 hypothetical protein AvCA6_12260 [Azotobacter vinelandii CA6]